MVDDKDSRCFGRGHGPRGYRLPVYGRPAMDLLLVRHALPVRIEDAGQPANPELTDEGHGQAAALAAWLAGERLDAVYSSPLARAMQTAAPVAAAHGLEIVVDDELAEFDRDAHFYIPVEELRATRDPRWLDMIEGRWGQDGEVDRFTFRRVVVEAIERVIEANAGRVVAAVCHGGVINAYLSHVLGLDEVMFYEPHYTSVSRVRAARTGQRQLGSLNETGHLRGART
jgi:2,3-bisphosphoglycerate-dependent phosphoglycerate mutase